MPDERNGISKVPLKAFQGRASATGSAEAKQSSARNPGHAWTTIAVSSVGTPAPSSVSSHHASSYDSNAAYEPSGKPTKANRPSASLVVKPRNEEWSDRPTSCSRSGSA